MDKKERKYFDRTGGMNSPLPRNWRRCSSPKSNHYGHGWVVEMDRAYSDGKNAVLVRTVETEEYGPVLHAAIRNFSGTDIPWAEKQRIKNELFGENRMAIEFFPKESQLVDEAPMYHLWVFVESISFPFGLHDLNEKE